jgi:hypothetical protein
MAEQMKEHACQRQRRHERQRIAIECRAKLHAPA